MFIGVEYVTAAYVIWVCTFVVYIWMTKRRMRIAVKTVELIKQRVSESSDKSHKKVIIENQD